MSILKQSTACCLAAAICAMAFPANSIGADASATAGASGMTFFSAGVDREHRAINPASIELNDIELLIQASGSTTNPHGWIPVVVVVTYEGAGIPGLVASQFTAPTNSQIVPPGGSALALLEGQFNDQGGGRYYLGVQPFDTNWLVGEYHFVLKVDARPEFKASGMTVVEVENDQEPLTPMTQ